MAPPSAADKASASTSGVAITVPVAWWAWRGVWVR